MDSFPIFEDFEQELNQKHKYCPGVNWTIINYLKKTYVLYKTYNDIGLINRLHLDRSLSVALSVALYDKYDKIWQYRIAGKWYFEKKALQAIKFLAFL